MLDDYHPATAVLPTLDLRQISQKAAVLHAHPNRPAQRNVLFEGRRGIFVGCGGSARFPRPIVL